MYSYSLVLLQICTNVSLISQLFFYLLVCLYSFFVLFLLCLFLFLALISVTVTNWKLETKK